jgi:hypothetical protein
MEHEQMKQQSIEWSWKWDQWIEGWICKKQHQILFRDGRETLFWPSGESKQFDGYQPAMKYAMEHPNGPE